MISDHPYIFLAALFIVCYTISDVVGSLCGKHKVCKMCDLEKEEESSSQGDK